MSARIRAIAWRELASASLATQAGFLGDLEISSSSTEGQKHSQNLAPVLVFSRKLLPVPVFTSVAPLARQHQ